MLLKFKPADMSSGGLVRTGGGSSERSCSGAGGCKVDIDPEKNINWKHNKKPELVNEKQKLDQP